MRSTLLVVAAALLQACAQAPSSATPSASGHEKPPTYAPDKHEQFVLVEKPVDLQKYGFDGFCVNTKTFACTNRLDYDRYVGMKGYFKTHHPVRTDSYGYEFWPIILENGQEFYYVCNERYGGRYGTSADIVPLEQYEKTMTYSAEPLVPGSDVSVESVQIRYGKDVYALSNGDSVGHEQLAQVREIATRFPASQAPIAEALLDFHITYDQVENRWFVQPKGSSLRNEAKLYIGLTPNHTWLRMKIQYYGGDWLFVRSYKVAADSLRWQSPPLRFERDHSGSSVWEWIDKSPTDEDLRIMRALADADNPVIRFQGSQYYSDFKLAAEQQESINNTLKLYELLTQ